MYIFLFQIVSHFGILPRNWNRQAYGEEKAHGWSWQHMHDKRTEQRVRKKSYTRFLPGEYANPRAFIMLKLSFVYSIVVPGVDARPVSFALDVVKRIQTQSGENKKEKIRSFIDNTTKGYGQSRTIQRIHFSPLYELSNISVIVVEY